MMKNRRSDIEIIGEILSLSKEGARKTEILYQANLSYQLLQEYMELLLEKRLLEERTVKNNGSKESKTFHTTVNGNELLTAIQNMFTFFNKNSG